MSSGQRKAMRDVISIMYIIFVQSLLLLGQRTVKLSWVERNVGWRYVLRCSFCSCFWLRRCARHANRVTAHILFVAVVRRYLRVRRDAAVRRSDRPCLRQETYPMLQPFSTSGLV